MSDRAFAYTTRPQFDTLHTTHRNTPQQNTPYHVTTKGVQCRLCFTVPLDSLLLQHLLQVFLMARFLHVDTPSATHKQTQGRKRGAVVQAPSMRAEKPKANVFNWCV